MREPPRGDLARLPEADDLEDVLRPGAPPGLVRGAVEEAGELDAGADEERPDALRRVELVPGQREEVDAEDPDVDGHLPDRLRGVGVDEDALLVREAGDLREVLDRPDLVVGVHDRDEDRLGRQRLRDVARVDAPRPVHRDAGDPEALLLEDGARLEDGRVLDGRGDDVAPLRPEEARDAVEDGVVPLRPPAREDDLLGPRAEERGDLAPRGFDGGARLRAAGVAARGVPEVRREVREHRLGDFRVRGRRGVVVEVDRALGHGPIIEAGGRGAAPDERNRALLSAAATILPPEAVRPC